MRMMIRLIFLSMLALLGVSPSNIDFWQITENTIQRITPLNSNYEMVIDSTSALIDNQEFCLIHSNNQVRLENCYPMEDSARWASPPTWQVDEAFFADLNHDGQQEAVLLVWRPFQPWPVDRFLPSGGRIADFHDRQGVSCHLILIGWNGEKFKEVWAGSALVDPIRQIHAADLDGDGYDDLVALEYIYDSNPQNGTLVIWNWNGFGFSLKSRLEDSSFSRLQIFKDEEFTILGTQ